MININNQLKIEKSSPPGYMRQGVFRAQPCWQTRLVSPRLGENVNGYVKHISASDANVAVRIDVDNIAIN